MVEASSQRGATKAQDRDEPRGIAYNANTKKYVLNEQYQGTPNTQQFFATSDTPAGPFHFEGPQAVLAKSVRR